MTLGYPRIFVCPLDSLSAFYKWHDPHARPSSTDGRRYTQQPLHRAAAHVLAQRGLCTEKLLHTGWKKHSSAEPALLLFELLFVFCFLFLITYLSCPPSQVHSIHPFY